MNNIKELTFKINFDTGEIACTEVISEGYMNRLVTVPAGFYAEVSVPRILKPFYPHIRRFTYAAIFHDYMYSISMPRKFADQMFRQLMKRYGVKRWRYNTMYIAVRLFGWWPYYLKG